MPRFSHNPQPLDPNKLEDLALAYVARFATTRVKLEGYLRRKLRERGWCGSSLPAVEELSARFVEAGYVDDAAYARAKSGALLRRGYGIRRVGQVLSAAGIENDVREQMRPVEGDQRASALTMARKRGFGPFGRERPDPARREKQIAAMLRAGHVMDHALTLIDARSIRDAEDWAAGAEDTQ